MFALFFNLYIAMLTGSWENTNIEVISQRLAEPLRKVLTFLTSLFNNVDTPFAETFSTTEIFRLISLVLALITSIGIVVMAVKGIKRVFGVFFMGIR